MSRQRFNWSPEPEVGAEIKVFRHDPYSKNAPVVYGYTAASSQAMAMPAYGDMGESSSSLPDGTRHPQLWGRVSFIAFPSAPFVTPAETIPPAGAPLVRCFLGQLPYFVTDMELNWICYMLGGGQAVMFPERIMKRQSGGERLPTGCIHGYATPDAISCMAANMHKRMLVDDTGVWQAQTDEELTALCAYVAAMKSDKSKRVAGRPYDTVVVQEATSNFIPACPVSLTEFPTERGAKRMATPPPAYVAPPTYYGAY